MPKPKKAKPKNHIRVAVRTVVEFSIHGEDLVAGGSQRLMLEGARAHRARQGRAAEKHAGYEAEVALSIAVPGQSLTLEVTGRADGLFVREGALIVEEIKLASREAVLTDARPEHWAQAACYGHILCAKRELSGAVLRVLYVAVSGEPVACFERAEVAADLAENFAGLVRPYLAYIEAETARRTERDAALAALAFPFDGYRPGQRDFAANVYIAIRDGKRLLAQAPTGIGKTMAALFPALKALGEGRTNQVYYLTARTTGRAVALETLARLQTGGLPLRTLELVAKEKCCPREGGVHCDPEACPYAKGFFLRLDVALVELFAQTDWRHEAVLTTALRHQVCPFEFSLCLCETADVVVCDYNYAFDPGVRLQRVFLARRDQTLLVDEAHHLVDRARDMLSVALDSRVIRQARRAWRAARGMKGGFYQAATALLKAMEAERAAMTEKEDALPEPPAWRAEIERFAEAADKALTLGLGPGRELLDAFLMAQRYLVGLGRFDEGYMALRDRTGKELSVCLMCLNPAPYLQKVTEKLRGVVLFSATLTPLRGYAQLLGVDTEADGLLALPAPFPREHLRVVCQRVSTRWAHRAITAEAVAAAIAAMVQARAGNYLAMFPSYAYLRQVRELLEPLLPGAQLLAQEGGMDEAARGAFLAEFVPRDGTLLGLVVMGGAFAEGVDLPGDRLRGVAVVGLGLPQVGAEREALRAYYQRTLGDGFAYAYRYPGVTRVTQAVGRVIRTAEDIGVALLIDDRFLQPEVAALLPPGWQPLAVARDAAQVGAALTAFWRERLHGEKIHQR